MSKWKYAPVGLVIAAIAMMTVPDMIKERAARAKKAESDALIEEIEKKLAAQEARDKEKPANQSVDDEEAKEKIARELYEYMVQEQKKCKSDPAPNSCIEKLNKQLGLK